MEQNIHQSINQCLWNMACQIDLEFKDKNVVSRANDTQRLVILGLVSLGTVFSLRNVTPGPLKMIRNAFISYFGYGLIIAPEVYNPFLVRNQK